MGLMQLKIEPSDNKETSKPTKMKKTAATNSRRRKKSRFKRSVLIALFILVL